MIAMLRPIQPYVEYFLNQDYIAEFLCINKEKPELECNGKCHLVKAIEKQQENDSSLLRISLENYPIGFVNILKIEKKQELFTAITHTYLYNKLYCFSITNSEFHPPDSV